MVKCNHCRLEYHSEGQLPTDEYHAMERISTVRDLHIKFEDGESIQHFHVVNEYIKNLKHT